MKPEHEAICTALKCGEYDGNDIMKARLAIEDLSGQAEELQAMCEMMAVDIAVVLAHLGISQEQARQYQTSGARPYEVIIAAIEGRVARAEGKESH